MDISPKIIPFDELVGIAGKIKSQGKKLVLCHGVFDLVHPGHILHFKAAKKKGDVLIVTLTRDEFVFKGPGRPYFNQRLRLETIASLEAVDYVALNKWPTAIETIKELKPDYYAKGSDYAQNEKDITGNIALEVSAVRDAGGQVVYTDEEMFSSSTLINSFFQDHAPQTRAYLQDFKKYFTSEEIIACLKGLKDLNVLVLGEAILDQYHYCQPLAKTPKDSIVAVKHQSEEDFAGGTLAIANHLANFCRQVSLISIIGNEEEHQRYFRSKLASNVEFIPIIADDRTTIIKRRFVEREGSSFKKMFEIQFVNDEYLNKETENQVVKQLIKKIEDADLVVVGDFGHGMMTPRLKELLYDSGKFLAINTQSNSANMGFNPVTTYKRGNYICLDEPELRFAAHSKYGKVEVIAESIKRKLEAKDFMVSLGANGNILFDGKGDAYSTPIFSKRVVDRTGAGDALFSITAPCVYKDYDRRMVGFVANCVGALAVETVCNRDPIDPTQLYKFITYLMK